MVVAMVLANISALFLTAVLASASTLAWGGGYQDRTSAEPEFCNFVDPCASTPNSVSGPGEVVALAAGDDHNTALLKTGAVVAWGYNKFGELGDGTTGASEVAAPVSGLSEVKAIAASDLVLALLKNGTVMTWGSNDLGQLGNGTRGGFSDVPIPITGLSEVTEIAASHNCFLALLKNGTVMAWGDSGYRQLGDESYADVPISVDGLNEVAAIGAGGVESLALLKNGTVMGWGRFSQVPTAVSGLEEVSAIGAGGDVSLALLKNGTVKAWGGNGEGQLGDGTTGTQGAPTDVPVAVSDLSEVTAISAGEANSLALLKSGSVKALGWNEWGQLGDGTTISRNDPLSVVGLSEVTAIATGGQFSLAVGTLGQIPKVRELAPHNGPAAGGTQVMISGSNFTGATAVHFGPNPAMSFTINSDSSITAIAPAPAEDPTEVPVTVSTSAGTSSTLQVHPDTETTRFELEKYFEYVPTVTRVEIPNTKITRAMTSRRKSNWKFLFRFEATEGSASGYECELLGGRRRHRKHRQVPFSPCISPKIYEHVEGKYEFEVRADGATGVDPTPATTKISTIEY